MQRRLVQNFTFILEWGKRDLFIDEAHTALGIFPVFFPCMLPTPLCGIFSLTLACYDKIYHYYCTVVSSGLVFHPFQLFFHSSHILCTPSPASIAIASMMTITMTMTMTMTITIPSRMTILLTHLV